MMTPDRNEIERLLSLTRKRGIPFWRMEEKQSAYDQLKYLYEHWYKQEWVDKNHSHLDP